RGFGPRELELGLCGGDLLVAEAGACERERLFGRTKARRRLVGARGREIDVALRGQSALVEAALPRELLLGVAERGACLGDARLGSLDLLRPAAGSDELELRLGDADPRLCRAQRFAIRLVVERREQRARFDAIALLVLHLGEAPADAKTEAHLADVDVAVERQRPAAGALTALPAEYRGGNDEHDGYDRDSPTHRESPPRAKLRRYAAISS